jgi:maltokinase
MVAELRGALARGELPALEEGVLERFIVPQRWFGSKAREVAHIGVLDAIPLRLEEPLLASVLVEARFAPGTHEVYQVLVGLRPSEEGWDRGVIAEADGHTLYEALTDPAHALTLLDLMRRDARLASDHATTEFHWVDGARDPGAGARVRPIGAEQSNSSVVFDDALVLKLYRRVEAGINPELEVLRFLTERGFDSVPALAGWYDYSGRLMEATLGVLQEFLPGARDGWELALEELSSEPDRFLERLAPLGDVIGRMHTVLASDSTDPAFAPEDPSVEALGLLTATVDEEIERIFFELPDNGAVAAIAGRGEEVREQLRVLTHLGGAGRVIRTHGDLHLGQTLLAPRGWVVLDFEGEPARSLPERRRKRSPLRDVAGMMRSFAYVASAGKVLRGVTAPAEWEERARERFLEGYMGAVDPALLPAGRHGVEQLLAVFELEKAVYELRYELNNRPEWVPIPVAGIARLLEAQAA